MKKLIVTLSTMAVLASGVMASSSIDQKAEQRRDESQSQTNSLQKQEQDSISKMRQESRGQETSQNREIRNSLSTVRSATQNVSRIKDNKIQLTLNPIPILFEILAQDPQLQYLFFVTNQEIGTDTYYNGDPEIIDNLKKNWQEGQRSNRGAMDKEAVRKINAYLNDYYLLSIVLAEIVNEMQNMNLTLGNIYPVSMELMEKAFKTVPFQQRIVLHGCNYADTGMHDIYNCDRTWSFQLTGDVPIIAKYGKVIFSKDHIDGIQAQLQVSAGSSINDSYQTALNMNQDYVLTNAMRQYVGKLEQEGQTKTANQIKQAVTQKAYTTGLNTVSNSATQAINSGNPLAVLKVFQ